MTAELLIQFDVQTDVLPGATRRNNREVRMGFISIPDKDHRPPGPLAFLKNAA
jgi:hypothetical protein